jgi:hypothetical protein
MTLLSSTNTYYEIRFGSTRYVHNIVLLANYWDSCSESKNYRVTVGDETGANVKDNHEVFDYSNASQYGVSFKVAYAGKSVGIIRKENNKKLSFSWIGIFTTATNCTGTFAWTDSRTDWPEKILISTT